jgi:hypothetical protein
LRFLCFKSLFFCIQSCLIRREFVSLTLQLQLLLLILKLPDPVVQSLNLSGVILLLVTRGEGKHACEASKREKTSSHIRAVYWTVCIPAIFNPRMVRRFRKVWV